MVMATTGIHKTNIQPPDTASLCELAFTVTCSVSGQSFEVKQHRARLVAGWVTQALEQGRLGSCAHAGYHQYYSMFILIIVIVWRISSFDCLPFLGP